MPRGAGCKPPAHLKLHEPYAGYRPRRLRRRPAIRPVVVGTGPAGLFAAWALAKAGACPWSLNAENAWMRVWNRSLVLTEGGPLDPDSNIQFERAVPARFPMAS